MIDLEGAFVALLAVSGAYLLGGPRAAGAVALLVAMALAWSRVRGRK